MGITFERKINYYETDRMGVVHHSNYIRYLEEARCFWLEQVGMPFSYLEEKGITIPVLGINCTYKYHVTFDDIIQIHCFIKEYSGVRIIIGYEVKNKETQKIVLLGESMHCFTNKDLKPINLKNDAPEFSIKFQNMKDE